MTCKDCIHYDVCLMERDGCADRLTADGLFKVAEVDCTYFRPEKKSDQNLFERKDKDGIRTSTAIHI